MSFQIQQKGSRVDLLFDNKEQRNCFGLQEARELQGVLKSISNCKVLVWRSAGERSFCSGGNLKDYAKLKNKADGLKINREIRSILNSFVKLPIVKVAVVEGDCWGGGLEILSCFQYVISLPHVLYGLWQSKNGLTTGWNGGQRLSEHNLSLFKNHLMLGHAMSAYEAYQLSWIHEIVSFENLESSLNQWLQSVENIDEKLLESILSWSPSKELSQFENLWWSDFHRKSLKAFTS